MKLNELKSNPGSRKEGYRIGRGLGSGNGKTAGKGHKGQNARSGGGVRLGFEGGQLPLYRRIPKRGFNHKFAKTVYATINVGQLEGFKEDEVITLESLIGCGMIKKGFDGLKVLGEGSLTKKVTVKANAFSKSAKDAIEKVGGVAEVL